MSTRSRREVHAVSNYDEDYLAELHEESKKRKPTKEQALGATARKAPLTVDGKPGSLSWMMTSEKSPLCKVDLSKVINGDTWFCLFPQDREALSALLPPTVYPFFEVSLPSYHPSKQGHANEITPMLELDGIEADPSSFLNCPHFEAAQVTFQDHLYSGWYGKRHIEDIQKYQRVIEEGTGHAPWKDEVWEEEQRREEETENNARASSSWRSRDGLTTMISHGLAGEGDIIAYKRTFPELNVVIEKDILLLQTGTSSITVVVPAKNEPFLPLGMLFSNPNPPSDGSLQQMTVHTLEQLELAILEMDNRISQEKRLGGNSWKRFTLWKWRKELEEQSQAFGVGPRGPREKRGTFFYLRGAYLPQK